MIINKTYAKRITPYQTYISLKCVQYDIGDVRRELNAKTKHNAR